MKVTTKSGDRGRTDLLFGGRERKDGPRMEAVGAVDELNSLLGLVKTEYRRGRMRTAIETVQKDLFILSSELVVRKGLERKLEFRVDRARMDRLEKLLSDAERRAPKLDCCFLIPGGSRKSALLDVCRAVARRAERRAFTLRRAKALRNPLVPIYLNRLSDLLFLLARAEEKRPRRFTAS
jgi:cob(I)alamin adenosyltransferase